MPVILFLGILIFVIIFISVKKNKVPEAADTKLVISEDYASGNTETIIRERTANHLVATVYMCPERNDVWVCRNCACENPWSETKCCVCNQKR